VTCRVTSANPRDGALFSITSDLINGGAAALIPHPSDAR
jgi:hypothetical protein